MYKGSLHIPILPIYVSANGNRKLIYGLIDSGSEETLIDNNVSDFLNNHGNPLDVVLVTANGRRSFLQRHHVTFDIRQLMIHLSIKLTMH